jgi:hypothetical protein
LVPVSFQVLGADFVDFFEGGEVRDAHFVRRESHDATVFLVERINVEDSLTSHYCAFEAKVREAGVPWTREMARRTSERGVDELEG